MPREEDLPPSKKVALNDEIGKETKRFIQFISSNNNDEMISLISYKQKINWLISYMNRQNAINNLIISSLIERIERLENEIS